MPTRVVGRDVIAANSYLATHAREQAQRVEVIPSCVEPSAPADARARETGR